MRQQRGFSASHSRGALAPDDSFGNDLLAACPHPACSLWLSAPPDPRTAHAVSRLSGRDEIQLTAIDTGGEKKSLKVSDPVRDLTKEIVEVPLLNLAKKSLDSAVRKIFFTE